MEKNSVAVKGYWATIFMAIILGGSLSAICIAIRLTKVESLLEKIDRRTSDIFWGGKSQSINERGK